MMRVKRESIKKKDKEKRRVKWVLKTFNLLRCGSTRTMEMTIEVLWWFVPIIFFFARGLTMEHGYSCRDSLMS